MHMWTTLTGLSGFNYSIYIKGGYGREERCDKGSWEDLERGMGGRDNQETLCTSVEFIKDELTCLEKERKPQVFLVKLNVSFIA